MFETEPRPPQEDRNIFLRQENLDTRDKTIQQAVSRIAKEFTNIELADNERSSVSPEVVIVGGYVRDLLFRNFFKVGKKSKDADLEIYGVPIHRVKEVLDRLFPGNVKTVGASFQVFTVFLGGGLDIDVAIPRVESKKGGGHKDYEVTGVPDLPKKEAARRRDFTINAMSLNPLTGEIYDFYGGQVDVENRVSGVGACHP
jgi:tRNA nucleotidyltransferase (CCA-adding enzyme)